MSKKKFIKLSWEILCHRINYYHYDAPTISDLEYDQLERQYLETCKEYGYEPTAISVGIDLTRPSIQCAIGKIERINSNKIRD